jgi:hypothetical protein
VLEDSLSEENIVADVCPHPRGERDGGYRGSGRSTNAIRLARIQSTLMIRRPFPSRLRVAERRQFTVLALESSADDTCAAVVTSSRKILSNVVLKQNHV